MVRRITNDHRTLGSVATSHKSPDGKVSPILSLTVYGVQKHGGTQIWVDLLTEGKKVPNLRLRPDAALEIVKGILQDLPDISIIANEELLNLFREKLATEKREIEAIGNVLSERRGK